MPESPLKNLHLLSLTDRDMVNGYFKKFPPAISEFTFTNLFAWRQTRPIWINEMGSSLLFLVADKDQSKTPDILFGPPTGPDSVKGILQTLGKSIWTLERFPADRSASLKEMGLVPIVDRNNADYVYRVDDLAQLKGRNFAKKRNHIKQCLEQNSCTYVELNGDHIGELLDMQEKWCADRECSKSPGLCGEYLAIKETLSHYEEFQLIGGAIRVNGSIAAYAIGERLNETTAVCHFEKAMPHIHGLSQLINKWFAENSLKAFEFVNREQDLGIPGLRMAKESYYPCAMVEKIKVTLSGKPGVPAEEEEACPLEESAEIS